MYRLSGQFDAVPITLIGQPVAIVVQFSSVRQPPPPPPQDYPYMTDDRQHMSAIETDRQQRSLTRGHRWGPAFVWKGKYVLFLLSSCIIRSIFSTLVCARSEEILLLFNFSGASLVFGPRI